MTKYPDPLRIRFWGHVVLAFVWLGMATLALVHHAWIAGAVAGLLFALSSWVIRQTASKISETEKKR